MTSSDQDLKGKGYGFGFGVRDFWVCARVGWVFVLVSEDFQV